jgi:hypothetical protein
MYLPIPAALKADLTAAAARKQGFLMQDSAKIAAKRSTTFAYERKPAAPGADKGR